MKKHILSVILLFLVAIPVFSQSIEERFKGKDKLSYRVYFNAIPSGTIEWEYMGREVIDGKQAEVLYINSDTKILKFLDMTSKEKVYLDSETHLPLKVERDILLFGNKELIEELYDQDEGKVTIVKTIDNESQKEVLQPGKPVHNILALLYFFPEDIELKQGEFLTFNLPTQKVKIKILPPRPVRGDKEKKEAFFLKGRGAKRFNLWLDKEERLPLRLEFIVPLGKVTILQDK